MNHAIKPGPETRSPAGLPELWVVVPTFKERDNVTVHPRLKASHAGRHLLGSRLFVDDNSPGGTWEVVRAWCGRIACPSGASDDRKMNPNGVR